MGKKSKIALIVSACLCIAGLVFFGAGWLAGGAQYLKDTDMSSMEADADRGERIYIQEKTEIDAIEGFDIQLDYADLYIKPSEDDAFYIEYALDTVEAQDPIAWDVADGILTMREKKISGSVISLPDIGVLFGAKAVEYRNDVVLYVPEWAEFTQSALVLDYGDFTVNAPGVAISNIKIAMDYGDMFVKEAEINNGYIYIDDGDCELEEVQMAGLKFEMEYGDLSWNGGSAEAVAFDIEDGNADFDSVRFAGDCSIVDEYGNITLKMTAEDLMYIDMDLATDYGKIYTPAELEGNGGGDAPIFVRKTDDAQGMLKIFADDGNITVEIAKNIV